MEIYQEKILDFLGKSLNDFDSSKIFYKDISLKDLYYDEEAPIGLDIEDTVVDIVLSAFFEDEKTLETLKLSYVGFDPKQDLFILLFEFVDSDSDNYYVLIEDIVFSDTRHEIYDIKYKKSNLETFLTKNKDTLLHISF